jgi:FkbM family methyltransferase
MGRNIYIDLGANVGDTVDRHLAGAPDAQVFAFEPNPRLIAKLRNRFRSADNVAIYEAACWILDGQTKLYLGHDLSSTLIEGKAPTPEHPEFDISYKDFALVRTIDFARWLLETFNEGDDICVKMDIEGSEYKVLRRLIDTGAIGLMDELRCEWHYDRYPVGNDEHLRIKELTKARVRVIDWH